MKKKLSKKLSLSRETLGSMNRWDLGKVQGGALSLHPEEEWCQQELTIPHSVCDMCGGGTLATCTGPAPGICYSAGPSCVC